MSVVALVLVVDDRQQVELRVEVTVRSELRKAVRPERDSLVYMFLCCICT